MQPNLPAEADSRPLGSLSQPYIAHLPMDGRSMIILDLPHSCWRESHEDKAADGERTVCTERWTRTPPSGQGSSENRQDVWDADLCVGKRQGGDEETLSFLATANRVSLIS